jgi:hypothetical protein
MDAAVHNPVLRDGDCTDFGSALGLLIEGLDVMSSSSTHIFLQLFSYS